MFDKSCVRSLNVYKINFAKFKILCSKLLHIIFLNLQNSNKIVVEIFGEVEYKVISI